MFDFSMLHSLLKIFRSSLSFPTTNLFQWTKWNRFHNFYIVLENGSRTSLQTMFLANMSGGKTTQVCVTCITQYHHKPLDLHYVCYVLMKLQFTSVEVVMTHGLVMPFISGSHLCRCLLLVSVPLCSQCLIFKTSVLFA